MGVDERRKALACYEDLSKSPRYLGRDGQLHDSFVTFGSAVYSIGSDRDGRLWVGCKPEGIYRLTPKPASGYTIDYFGADPDGQSGPYAGGVYDIECDNLGRLWLAMIDGGIDCVVNPEAESPRFMHLISDAHYPPVAKRVRDISIAGDTAVLAATTGGLLAFPLPGSGFKASGLSYTLHVSEPGREDAIGNIATMHVLTARDGNVFVATESDGVNMLPSSQNLLDAKARFVRYNTSAGVPGDVAYALAEDSGNGSIWTVSGNTVYNLDSRSAGIVALPSVFRPHDVHFSDARPVNVGGNSWLVGLENGAWVIDFDRMINMKGNPLPVVFTSVSLQNRPDSLLSALTDSLILAPDERNVTINFASLSYGETESIRYSFSLDDGDSTQLGSTRSVTFLDLAPGTYTLRVRAADSTGSRPDGEGRLVIVVTPTFWETPLAKCLYVLLVLAVIGSIAWTVIYIRRIRRKQRELLEAYMQLIEKSAVTPAVTETDDTTVDEQPAQPVAQLSPQPSPSALLSPADEQFMEKVMDFVNANMGNADAGVDEMAAHTATSRSSLNRKMKSLFGVTPADFIRESRLKRAAVLLVETDRSITDIALDCGFADINYFGKCFKASRKVSPTAFRKNHMDSND
ncbi:MAG: helix-turn-helix domain-containing protein [Duncaniella sp.]|nr:helix-turn-helix domain-containing protein [Duncaniella sp.]